MKLLLYIKKYKVSASIGFVFKIIEAMLELAVPVIMVDIIDIGIQNQDSQYIYQKGLILLVFGIAGYISALICQYFASKTSQSVGTMIRHDVYKKINTFTYTNVDALPAATLTTRISNDIIQLQLAIAMTIRLTSRAPFLIIGSLFMAFSISGKLAMIFIIGSVLLATVLIGITIWVMPYFHQNQKKLDTIYRMTKENLQGVRIVRAFSNQKKEKKRFHQETQQQQEIQIQAGKIQALLNPITYILVNIAILLIVYLGGKQVSLGILTQGEIMALVSYMNQILLALLVFINVLTLYNKARAAYVRVTEVLEIEPTIKDEGSKREWNVETPTLVFEKVFFAYDTTDVIKDISFVLQPGETMGIIGGTGAGKTTVVNIIGRFYEAQKGNIYVGGHAIHDVSLEQLRKQIAIVPQQAALLSGTIRENLQMGKVTIEEEEIYRALAIAQALDFVRELPEGLDTMIVQGGKNISGGQRQRLTIARAILRKPKVLILDNSDSALDAMTSYALRKALQTLKETSSIIVSQRTFAVEQADHILVLYHGEAVGYGNHQQLLENCQVYQEIYTSQKTKETS